MAGQGGAGSPSSSRSLEVTPTWAVAVVCFVLIALSVTIEHLLDVLTKVLARRRKSLNKALDKIKSELMLLGFISLLLTVSQGPISKICIPKSLGDTFLPCADTKFRSNIVEESTCVKKGKISLLSKKGVEQLQMLIFVFAFFHVFSCVLTFGLGMAKMKRWKLWEDETKTLEYQYTNDPRRFRLTRQTSFAKRHMRFWSNHSILRWPACFIRQFTGYVSKTDYFVLRHGFIMAHFGEDSTFDFQKFLRRALDEDLQVVVGTSLWIWIFAVLFIFFNANGFHNYFWLPFIPLVILLLIGTKLQVIITKMFLQSHDESTVVRGTLLVKPSDNFFWFKRPQLLLQLMHFVLFQNSFQLAFFTWTWYKHGFRSCFHRETENIILTLSVGLLVQLLCGYVTLPLYALVTQMGSSMKETVFTEKVIVGLRNWLTTAKRNVATRNTNTTGPTPELSPSYSIDTSVSSRQEFVMSETNHAEITKEGEIKTAEITKEGEIKTADETQIYDGELSFGISKLQDE